jgi:deazaflavin-dependent oxidoreductase (nitroreductase family)
MTLRQSMVDLGMKSMNRTHRVVLRVSGGRVLGTAFGMPAVELHTVGRRSGLTRSTMLTAPVVEDGRVVLVASKGGDDRHPDWYSNLVARPEVELTMDGERRPYSARPATAEDKERLWPRAVAAYQGYGGY